MAKHHLDISYSRSIDRALEDLIKVRERYDADHPQAMRLAAMIDALRLFKGQSDDGRGHLDLPA